MPVAVANWSLVNLRGAIFTVPIVSMEGHSTLPFLLILRIAVLCKLEAPFAPFCCSNFMFKAAVDPNFSIHNINLRDRRWDSTD